MKTMKVLIRAIVAISLIVLCAAGAHAKDPATGAIVGFLPREAEFIILYRGRARDLFDKNSKLNALVYIDPLSDIERQISDDYCEYLVVSKRGIPEADGYVVVKLPESLVTKYSEYIESVADSVDEVNGRRVSVFSDSDSFIYCCFPDRNTIFWSSSQKYFDEVDSKDKKPQRNYGQPPVFFKGKKSVLYAFRNFPPEGKFPSVEICKRVKSVSVFREFDRKGFPFVISIITREDRLEDATLISKDFGSSGLPGVKIDRKGFCKYRLSIEHIDDDAATYGRLRLLLTVGNRTANEAMGR